MGYLVPTGQHSNSGANYTIRGIQNNKNNIFKEVTMDIQDAAVYVGTYGKYNDGSLAGDWLYIADYRDKEAFIAAARKLHKDEREPEYMFQDWKNIPAGMINESWISDALFDIVQQLEEMDPEQIEAFYIFKKLYKYNLKDKDAVEQIEIFNDSYEGDFYNEQDFAYYMIDTYGYPEEMEDYFDYDAYARMLLMDGFDYYDGHIFRKPYY